MKSLLLLTILLLAACTPAPVCNEPYILVGNECCLDENNNNICDRDDPKPELKLEDVKEEQVTQGELEVLEEAKKLTAAEQMLDLIDQRVKSYTFITTYDKYDGSTWFIKNDIQLTRIDLHDVLTLKPGEFVDLLVFNNSDNTLKGYCRRKEHVCRDSLEREFDLDYRTYWVDTPVDILKTYKNKKEIVFKERSEIIDDRTATMLVYQEGKTKTTIWVDSHFGIPLKILKEKGKDKRVTTFENMAVNTVKDDVFHAFNVRPRAGRS